MLGTFSTKSRHFEPFSRIVQNRLRLTVFRSIETSRNNLQSDNANVHAKTEFKEKVKIPKWRNLYKFVFKKFIVLQLITKAYTTITNLEVLRAKVD